MDARHASHDFNSRSPYGERFVFRAEDFAGSPISTHAPHTGSDRSIPHSFSTPCIFQLTLPIRGAIGFVERLSRAPEDFNSRSPYGERSALASARLMPPVFQLTLPIRGAMSLPLTLYFCDFYFNSRSPYGERLVIFDASGNPADFNSRSPYGERSCPIHQDYRILPISTHAPHTGSDFRS